MEKYKTLIIYYHSGTGNALTAGQWMIEEAKRRGITTHIHTIDKDYRPDLGEVQGKTLIGFLYPTHGFNLSPAMLDFILHFPKRKGVDVFLLNTRAGGRFFNLVTPGLSGTALLLPMLILAIKGFYFKGARPLDMPSNWISLHPGYSSSWIKFIVTRCEKVAIKYINKLLDGKKVYKRVLIDLPIDIAIIPITIIYYFIGRFFLAKTFMANNKCNECTICEQICPVNAIVIKNRKPFWTYHCESCMRCMNTCPHQAIQTPHLLVVIGILIFNIPFSIYLSHQFNILNNVFVIFLLDSVIGMTLYFALYAIIQRISKYKLINFIFKYTSLTNFWRKYKAPNINIKDFNSKVKAVVHKKN